MSNESETEKPKRRTGLQTCDNCNKRVEDLVTRHGFIQTFYIEWVCEKCFKKLEGVDYEDYNEEHYYKSIGVKCEK